MMQSTQNELEFINIYLQELSNKSVRYGEDYMYYDNKPIKLNRTPAVVNPEEGTTDTVDTPIEIDDEPKYEINVKVLKPASQFNVGGLTSDMSILQLKQRIYQRQNSIPANRQRLLIKGKVLPDHKTLGELSVNEGTTVHLMLTAAPAVAEVKTGRFGISKESEEKLAKPEFWSALESTMVEQVGEEDAKLLMSKVKSALSA
ncbi:hypothetical protein BDB01DRAFT_784210 [Pilobolus umbonatus]|nr:hypothetical protein BDB01DRAFT_784210 [Pilobolus umbonatus]